MLKGKFKKKELELEEYDEIITMNEDSSEDYDYDDIEKEEFDTYEEYEENIIEDESKKERKIKKIINIVFAILIIVMLMISIDVICVARYNTGPFFAIRTNVYDDGGSKVYYGIGYKVIKYNQVQGRRDTKIGFWTMPYSAEPTTISALDLAIEFRNKPEETSQKYYKEFLRITGTVKEADKNSNKLVLQYNDPDEKYTLEINCPMAEKDANLSFEENEEVTIIGTAQKFTLKTSKKPNSLYMSDCFAE